jgi:hypothetical protein
MSRQEASAKVAVGNRQPSAPRRSGSTVKLRARVGKHTQNEGESHDVDENKGTENGMLEYPTIFMKTKDLFL